MTVIRPVDRVGIDSAWQLDEDAVAGVFDHQVDREERAEGVAVALGGEIERAVRAGRSSSAVFSSPVPIFEASGQVLGFLLKRIGFGIGKPEPLKPICAREQASRPSAPEALRTTPSGRVTTVCLISGVISFSGFVSPSLGTVRLVRKEAVLSDLVSEGSKVKLAANSSSSQPVTGGMSNAVSKISPGFCHRVVVIGTVGGRRACSAQLVALVSRAVGAAALARQPIFGPICLQRRGSKA